MATTTRPAPADRARGVRAARGSRLRGRRDLYTSYAQDMALLNTPGKRWGVGAIVALGLALPWMFVDPILQIFAIGFAYAIGAIGLNLVTGYAGQVSLGHAVFVGIGAYTAAALTGDVDGRQIGLGLQFIVALPAAGVVAGLVGWAVSPVFARFRGLYLAIVTLGLVFLGEHIFKEWTSLTGGLGAGRRGAIPEIMGWRFDQPGELLGVTLTANQQLFYLTLVLLIVFAVLARNLARSQVGRAFSAIRDRDIAAEIMGIKLSRYKAIAFAVSSFYAGIAGALFYTVNTQIDPASFGLLLSVQYIAMVLIGGVATISGSIMGALFIAFLPFITRQAPILFPFISTDPSLRDGGLINVFQLEAALYGVLIILFLILQPRGLFGLWLKVRNYWKGWPFSH
ncbi:branched-chain amino acid ABC transporter permease [Egibacter rhizosphaerae]|uniref:branched-chain amino acid ABC transporter permease n=1 Tax=Egibacter rhizosphaerae TaxID=1670831 RepID=UPI00197ACDBB|nr:branched-chain amino acid ABC transporter permease [Egibacter rhizosphaerae]